MDTGEACVDPRIGNGWARPRQDRWGLGQYERFAADIEPAAQVVVDFAHVTGGERVLDIACGTGNAALLAARAGGVVSGWTRRHDLSR